MLIIGKNWKPRIKIKINVAYHPNCYVPSFLHAHTCVEDNIGFTFVLISYHCCDKSPQI